MNVEPSASKQPTFLERLSRDLDRGKGDLPVLPRAAESALRLAQSPAVDFDEVVKVAESDPALAARFLGVANSALYYRGVPIRSIKAAVVRLGTQATRDLLYMAVYSGAMFRVPLYQALVEESFRHSIMVARMCRRLAELLGADPENSFLAGLLHDVGRARCLKIAARHRRLKPSEAEVREALSVLHARAGAALARSWHLPEEVAEACEFHHEPGDHPMALRVFAADRLAHHAFEPREVTEEDVREALGTLGIDEASAEHLIEVVREDALLVSSSLRPGAGAR